MPAIDRATSVRSSMKWICLPVAFFTAATKSPWLLALGNPLLPTMWISYVNAFAFAEERLWLVADGVPEVR